MAANAPTDRRTRGESEYILPAAAPAPAVAGAAEGSTIISYEFAADNRLVKRYAESSFLLPNGKTLGQFIRDGDIVGRPVLGSGMSGDTYLINFPVEKFVLKHITRTDKVSRAAIGREISFLARVKGYWWAVQLLAAQTMPDGSAYMLFPYIPGKSLFDVLVGYQNKTPGHISITDLKITFQNILMGLMDLHALGIIHRDVKPDNIWVPNAAEIAPFLLDFGLSADMGEVRRTAGTRNFIRPERLGKNRHPTPNDNFYALGKTARYVDEFAKPIYKQLMDEGLVGDQIMADAMRRFVGGRRFTRRRRTHRSTRGRRHSSRRR